MRWPRRPGKAGQASVWSFLDRTLHTFHLDTVTEELKGLGGPDDPRRLVQAIQPMLRASRSPLRCRDRRSIS